MLGEDFKFRHLVQAVEPEETTEVAKVRRPHVRGPRRVATARGAKVFGQPIGTIITRDMVERAKRSGKLKAGDLQPVGAKPKAAGNARQAARGGNLRAAKPKIAPVDRNNPHAQRVAEIRAKIANARNEDQLIGVIEELQADSILNTKAYDAMLDEAAAHADNGFKAKGVPGRKQAEAKPAPKKVVHPAPQKREPGAAAQRAAAKVAEPKYRPVEIYRKRVEAAKDENRLIRIVEELQADPAISDEERYEILDAIEAREEELSLASAERKRQDPYIANIRQADAIDLDAILARAENDDSISPQRMGAIVDAAEDRKKALRAAAPPPPAKVNTRMRRQQAIGRLRDAQNFARTDDLKTGGNLHQQVDNESAFNTNDKVAGHQIIRNARVQRFLGKIAAAKDEDTLVELAQKADQTEGLTEREKEQIFDALSNRMKKLQQTPKDRVYVAKVVTPGQERWEGENARNSPAGQFLEKGGAIDDLPDPDGLMQYMVLRRDRFDIQAIHNDQVSEAWSVADREKERLYFFKNTSNNGDAHMYGDGVNEYMAAKLGRGAIPDLFPDVEFAGRPVKGQNAMIRMEHLQQMYDPDDTGDNKVFFDATNRFNEAYSLKDSAPQLADPKQALAIHIFDYLIDQTDRHYKNYAWVDTPKGAVLVPLDNGGAFHAFEAEDYADRWGKEVEDVTYREWKAGIHRGGAMKIDMMVQEARRAYQSKGWGRDKLASDVSEMIDKFGKSDLDAIMADLFKRFPDMDEYEKNHVEGAALIWRNRLAMLDVDEIVRGIGL